MSEAKRNSRNQAHSILNAAKWEAARTYCKQQGITFRVVTENDIFHGSKR
jgi:indole-3-glycerol phosphate synthase